MGLHQAEHGDAKHAAQPVMNRIRTAIDGPILHHGAKWSVRAEHLVHADQHTDREERKHGRGDHVKLLSQGVVRLGHHRASSHDLSTGRGLRRSSSKVNIKGEGWVNSKDTGHGVKELLD